MALTKSGFPITLLESGLRLNAACWALGHPLPLTPPPNSPGPDPKDSRPPSHVNNTFPHLHLLVCPEDSGLCVCER